MNDTGEHFIELRSRKVQKENKPVTTQQYCEKTSTPLSSPQPRVEQLRKSIQEAGSYFRELSNIIDQSAPGTSFLENRNQSISKVMTQTYNKELADLMATNIPKFDLDSSSNPALELRSFIRACENVLNLFNLTDEEDNAEFFKLIRFRLGYNVQERITQDKFKDLQDLEAHLRSICHLKLNKGKLLREIRHERQHPNEDVSSFVERLRKLIAQGRSEYSNDKEFEREAIHTLKNAIRNELISIKLLDSNTNNFEELAEIAINRDSELHQRSYNVSKSENLASQDVVNNLFQKIKKLEATQNENNHRRANNASQDLLNDLIQKMKNLEAKQTASIQNIRYEPRFRFRSPNRFYTPHKQQQSPFCNYCKRSGHHIEECRTKARNDKSNNHRSFPRSNAYNNQQRPGNYISSGNRPHTDYGYKQPENPFKQPSNHNTNRNDTPNYNRPQQSYGHSSQNNYDTRNESVTCVRCKQQGHKSNNCYEIICSVCKEIGHAHTQCKQNSTSRRVHFLNGNQVEGNEYNHDQAQGNE